MVTDRLPTGDPGPTTVHAYTKIDGPTGSPEVTEFEVSDAALLAQVHHDWNGYRIVAAAAFLLLLGLALLSMREPVADIGVGVPFYPATLPPNLAIVDAERAVVIEHQDDHVRQRVDSLQQRLDESERLRLKAEARLQQALTTLGTGGRNVPGLPPEPPSSTALPTRATPGPRAKPALVEPAASSPPPPARRRDRTRRHARRRSCRCRCAAAAASSQPNHAPKKRTSKRSTAKPAAERTPTPRRSRADEPAETPAPTPEPRSDPVTVVADDVTVTSKPPAAERRDPKAGPRSSWSPTPAPAPVAAKSVAGPDDATDVLHRLVPEAESPAPLDDPRDLRARLARTAALKKPGSRERQGRARSVAGRFIRTVVLAPLSSRIASASLGRRGTAMTVRVLIVDDQEPFRQAARMVVELTDGFEVVGEAETGEDSVAMATDLQPDLVLMDVNLPGINGLDATRQILGASDTVVVLLLSTYEEAEYAPRAAECGAAAYIPKSSFGPDRLEAAWEAASV